MTFSMEPPKNIDAEKNTLGACFLARDAFHAAREIVRSADWFSQLAHENIWAAMERVVEENGQIDVSTVAKALQDTGRFEESGGGDYLLELTDQNPTAAANVTFHAKTVRDFHERRIVDEACKIGLQAARDCEGQVAMLAVQEHLSRLERTSDNARTAHISQLMVEFMESISEDKLPPSLLRTGIYSFDYKIGGLPRNQLVYLSARGGEGKTTFAQWIAAMIARDYGPVVYISTEVPLEELNKRYVAMEGRLRGQLLRTSSAQDLLAHYDTFSGVHARLHSRPLWLTHHYGPTWYDVEAEVRRVERIEKRPVVLVVVDRLEHVECGIFDETAKMNANSRSAKLVQGKLKTTLMAIVQPNQDEKRRSDPRPRITDLAYSGRLRADAQMIIQLYRPSYESRETSEDAEAWVNKNNGGPTGKVILRFLPEFPAYESGTQV